MDMIGTKEALLRRADAYANRVGLERSTVSLKLFNDGKTLQRIADGGDLRTDPLKAAWAALEKLERVKSAAKAKARKVSA